jgi:Phosphotransferase enzyme family
VSYTSSPEDRGTAAAHGVRLTGVSQEAYRWIHARVAELGLDITGPIEQPHVQPWSTVLRIPTTDGDLYFKASAPVQAFEVPLLTLLRPEFADRLPEVLAFDVDQAWMLMRDAGVPLREVVKTRSDVHHWLATVPLYAEIQIAEAPRVEELLELGVPDYRLERLPNLFDELVGRADVTPDERAALRGVSPRLTALCDELLEDPIPETLQHNDLHFNNVLIRDGRHRIFDWGDSSISHPFQTMRVTIAFLKWTLGIEGDDEIDRRVRDAYLEPWSSFGRREALVRSFDVARIVGGVSDALTEDRVVTGCGLRPEPDDPRAIPNMLREVLEEL